MSDKGQIESLPATESKTPAWYYATADRANNGPVSGEELRQLLKSGVIVPNTLVWNKEFGKTWKPIRDTELAFSENSPPPLPGAALQNWAAWTIALAPLITAVITIILVFF